MQSKDTFRDCKALLDRGRTVLFTGTGCQVHGLLSYLNLSKTDHTNLITIDFICLVFLPRKYGKSILPKYNTQKIRHVNFRDKSRFGWTFHVETHIHTKTVLWNPTLDELRYFISTVCLESPAMNVLIQYRTGIQILPLAITGDLKKPRKDLKTIRGSLLSLRIAQEQ